jgi:hypothetical protein
LLCRLSQDAVGERIWAPQQQETLAAAIAAADEGDTIMLAAGEFKGGVTIDKPLTIIGRGQDKTTVTGGDSVLTAQADLVLRNLTVLDGENGIFVNAGRRLTMTRCTVTGAKQDGIGFEKSPDTVIEIRDCLITHNGDGIDLESTQGLIVNTSFIANLDDGLDYDGDACVTCIGCRFADNGDDGIEIRLRSYTQAVLTDCEATDNGEDGVEVINTVLEAPHNVLILGRNRFSDNGRFGVGFVHAKREEAVEGDRSQCITLWGPNSFGGNRVAPVSENHVVEAQRAQPTQDTLTIQVTQGEEQRQVTIPLHPASPVGSISMRPAVHGGQAKDLEGIAIDGQYIYLADDSTPAIHVVERDTCRLVNSVETDPFPGSEVVCKGVEGLALATHGENPALLVADDEDSRLFTLDRAPANLGAILAQESTRRYVHGAGAEGVELIGEALYFACKSDRIVAVDSDRQLLPGYPVSYMAQGFGQHLAGVGCDGSRLLLTMSAYTGERKHTQFSLLVAVDVQTGEPLEAWHIPYSNDPRGVAYADRIAYVADGMSAFLDQDVGVQVSPGIRILLFALQEPSKIRLTDLPGRKLGTQ